MKFPKIFQKKAIEDSNVDIPRTIFVNYSPQISYQQIDSNALENSTQGRSSSRNSLISINNTAKRSIRSTQQGESIQNGSKLNNFTDSVKSNASILDSNFCQQHQQNFVSNSIITSKYTAWNFLPKNLFEQFRRIANFYFLCLCIINFVTDSPVSPLTTFLPLLFVITVTGVKQAYEDWKRHLEDHAVNTRDVNVFNGTEFQVVKQSHIKVGDIVQTFNDEEFPCDLLLLTSYNDHDVSKEKCDVTTANLDGETNLKTFLSPFSFENIPKTEDLANFSAIIQCQVQAKKIPLPRRVKFRSSSKNNSVDLRTNFNPTTRISIRLKQENDCGFMNREGHVVKEIEHSSHRYKSLQHKANVVKYFASSPDEKAIVEACATYGVVFEGDTNGMLSLDIQHQTKTFQLLQVLEFDSERKMMSVIVQDEAKRIWLFSKGAESTIFEKCSVKSDEEKIVFNATSEHINSFANLGLRTLAIGKRELMISEYKEIAKKLKSAKQQIKNREDEIKKVYSEVEKDLSLLGATGVEDLLQDGVQETLESLRLAGIKVWVLTGDKIETAVNIAYISGLFKKFTNVVYLTQVFAGRDLDEKFNEIESNIIKKESKIGLVVDGPSLLVLLQEEYKDRFFNVSKSCSSVICCRMTPKQKAEVVKLVKFGHPKRTVCAAIGDGANDVSMIQEAHVGIGIMGKEGRQAVLCSDFAFGRFRFLQRAFFVHGHWYYERISTLILFSFYKNVAFMTPQVLFSFDSAYSTQSLYEGFALTFFNTLFTAVPIIMYGLLEQVYSEDKLLKKCYLYREIRSNRNLSWASLILWTVTGLWHALIIYFGTKAATNNPAYLQNGRVEDFFLFGLTMTIEIIILANLKLIVQSRYQTLPFIASIIATLLLVYTFYLVYCAIDAELQMFQVFYIMHTTPVFYFTLVILIFICLLPDFLAKMMSRKLHKSCSEIFGQIHDRAVAKIRNFVTNVARM